MSVIELKPADVHLVQELLTQATQDLATQKATSQADDGPYLSCRDAHHSAALALSCRLAVEVLQRLSGVEIQDAASASAAGGSRNANAARSMLELPTEECSMLELHQQVLAAQGRVEELRRNVPATISNAISQHMAQLRPLLAQVTSAAEQGASGDTIGASRDQDGITSVGLSSNGALEAIQHMRTVLAQKMDQLPSLRARLHETEQRLGRVLGAIEADAQRPSPRTVEKVLLNRPCSYDDDDQSEAACIDQTRRRLVEALQGTPQIVGPHLDATDWRIRALNMADCGIVELDIAPLLARASAALGVGELIHGEAFSLFEAMSAMEVGNPKMDAAAAEPPPTGAADAPVDMAVAVLRATLDQLLVMEASWHCGNTLPQTVFTSLHMLQVDRLSSNVPLSAYCKGLLACVAAVRSLLFSASVCEEEDVNVHAYSLALQDWPSAVYDDTVATLSSAIEHCLQAAEQLRAAGSESPSQGEAADYDAIATRLKHRKQLCLGFTRLLQRTKEGALASAHHFSKAHALAQGMSAGADLDGKGPAAVGFNEHVNRHMLGPAPPRQVKLLSLGEAITYHKDMTDQLQKATSVVHVTDYTSLCTFVMHYARLRTCTIARSAAHLLILPPNGWPASAAAAPANPPSSNLQLLGEAASSLAADPSTSDKPVASTTADRTSANSAASDATTLHRAGSGASAASVSGHAASNGDLPNGNGNTASTNNDSNSPESSSTSVTVNGPVSDDAQGAASVAIANDSLPAGSGAPNSNSSQPAALPPVAEEELPPYVPSVAMMSRASGAPLKQLDGSPQNSEILLFLEQAVIAISNWCQAMMMNRSRQRRRLRRGLEDWVNMHTHALNADSHPELQEAMAAEGWMWTQPMTDELNGPLSAWIERETASAMLQHLLLGFELELYDPSEYCVVFWYADGLFTAQQRAAAALMKARPLPAMPTPAMPALPPKPTKPSLVRGGKNAKAAAAAAIAQHKEAVKAAEVAAEALKKAAEEHAVAVRRAALLEAISLEGNMLLCQGLLRQVVGLQLAGAIKEVELSFNTPQQRFDQRFAVYHTVARPEPMQYEHFLTAMDVGAHSAEHILNLAIESFKQVRQRTQYLLTSDKVGAVPAETVKELKALDMVAAQNSIAAGLFSKLHAGTDKQVAITFNFKLHPYYPTMAMPSRTVSSPAKSSS